MKFSRYHQGIYQVIHKEKYLGDVSNVIFRSGLERKYYSYCDRTPQILKWSSEECIVPYISPLDNRKHRYFVDLYVEVLTKDGTIKKFLIELKPESQTKEPRKTKKITRYYMEECKAWIVNRAKWDAAEAFCKQSGFEFKILTEKDLKGL